MLSHQIPSDVTLARLCHRPFKYLRLKDPLSAAEKIAGPRDRRSGVRSRANACREWLLCVQSQAILSQGVRIKLAEPGWQVVVTLKPVSRPILPPPDVMPSLSPPDMMPSVPPS